MTLISWTYKKLRFGLWMVVVWWRRTIWSLLAIHELSSHNPPCITFLLRGSKETSWQTLSRSAYPEWRRYSFANIEPNRTFHVHDCNIELLVRPTPELPSTRPIQLHRTRGSQSHVPQHPHHRNLPHICHSCFLKVCGSLSRLWQQLAYLSPWGNLRHKVFWTYLKIIHC